MITVETAQALCLDLVTPTTSLEGVPLAQAAGRVLRVDARSTRAQPPFASSAMDGYALRAADARPGAVLEVVGESAAGHSWSGTLAPGQALRIFTGAPVPAGADTVVIQENTSRTGDRLTLTEAAPPGANIRPAGCDFGPRFSLAAPRCLSAADLALLAAMNHPQVTVARRPQVALLATGDELVPPGHDPGPDQIIASNTYALKAMIDAAGGDGVILPIAPDREGPLAEAMQAMTRMDLAVTIGGASVGDHDLVGKVGLALGLERAFHKIAMRPGKPLIAGRLGAVPYLGLPGNPVSAIVTGHLFLIPMVRRWLGLANVLPQMQMATLGTDTGPTGPRAHYMRARVESGVVTPFADQDSSLLSVLAQANALLLRPLGDGPRRAGDSVPVLPL